MNVTRLLRRKPDTCPTCQQAIIQPTPSIIAAGRLAFATFGVGAAFLEYRRAVKREAEEAQLTRVYDTPVDQPLDEHLDHRIHESPDGIVIGTPDRGVTATPWPPSHPSLVDDQAATDAAD